MIEYGKASTLGSLGNIEKASEPDLSRIQGRLAECRNRLSDVHGKASMIGDGLFGGQPQNELGAECQPVRSGILGSIEDVIDGINREISGLEESVRRVANAVPH